MKLKLNARVKYRREGVAAVEVAVCLPVLILIFFSSLELTNRMFLQQAGTAAAYEAARMIAEPGGTEVAARIRAEEILRAHSVNDAVVSITPSITEQTEAGTVIQVSVSIPLGSNSTDGGRFVQNDQPLIAEVFMLRQ